MTENCISAEPAKNYDSLRKQFNALKMYANSKSKQLEIYQKRELKFEIETLKNSIEALNSERDMNAILTTENEQMLDALIRIQKVNCANEAIVIANNILEKR